MFGLVRNTGERDSAARHGVEWTKNGRRCDARPLCVSSSGKVTRDGPQNLKSQYKVFIKPDIQSSEADVESSQKWISSPQQPMSRPQKPFGSPLLLTWSLQKTVYQVLKSRYRVFTKQDIESSKAMRHGRQPTPWDTPNSLHGARMEPKDFGPSRIASMAATHGYNGCTIQPRGVSRTSANGNIHLADVFVWLVSARTDDRGFMVDAMFHSYDSTPRAHSACCI